MISGTRAGGALFAIAIMACGQPAPPATLGSRIFDSAGIAVITLDRPLSEIALGQAGAPNATARRLFEVDSMTHPVAVAFLASGDAAIVERSEQQVIIVDSQGRPRTTFGRPGDGPGEFRLPAGVAALGNDLVVLQSRPSNTLTLLSDGRPARTSVPEVRGDWGGWFWHRPDISLEFPGQSAPEVWSRRLRALDDSTFLVYLGPVEEDTSSAARALLLRFDRDLSLRDTVAALRAVQREHRPPTDPRGLPELFESVWGARTVWTAGEGFVAMAWSGTPEIEVRGTSGARVAYVRWPSQPIPVTPDDQKAFGAYVVRMTLAASPGASEMKGRMSDEEIEAMMKQFLGGFTFAATRPELTSLFLDDRCLWVAGFDPNDDADGTAHEWLVLDLAAAGTAPRIVTIGGPTERVVALDRGKAATIRLGDDGLRRVAVYEVPSCRGAVAQP